MAAIVGFGMFSVELSAVVQEQKSPRPPYPLLPNSVFLSPIVGVIVRLDCAPSPPLPPLFVGHMTDDAGHPSPLPDHRMLLHSGGDGY